MSKTILITGITGFIGSHLGDYFSNKGYNVIGLKRLDSDVWRCNDYYEKVKWIDIKEDWVSRLIELKPAIVIHSAWDGVISSERNDLKHQIKNLDFLADLLFIAKEVQLERFIGFGSQEEYGLLSEIANEDHLLNTNSSYGIAKVAAAEILEHFCESNNINWYWLRIFSVFGEKESYNWLIPSVIKKLFNNVEEIQLSLCQQKYAYLYVSDFVKLVGDIIEKYPIPISGVYNISGNNALALKEIVEKIKNNIVFNSSQTKLNFGALTTRKQQSMHLEGAMDKYVKNIGPIKLGDFDLFLKNTIDNYVNSLSSNL